MRSREENNSSYQVWCDVGGTFTDCFVVSPNGDRKSLKVLSHGIVKGTVERWIGNDKFVDSTRCQDPDGFWQGATLTWLNTEGKTFFSQQCKGFDANTGTICLSPALRSITSYERDLQKYELSFGLEAPVLATRLLLGCHPDLPLPPLQVRLGTTRGTNALLTRTGKPVAFVTTRGFSDLLRIGYQERPDLFALAVRKRPPLHHCVVEIDERLAADGSILQPLDLSSTERTLRELYASGIHSIAICLIHSYCNPVHEAAIEKLALEIGFECVRTSSSISPKIKAVLRAETTLVDGYLTPIIQSYLKVVSEQFALVNSTRLRIMTSAGGLVSAESYSGKDSVLSGPAGGAVAVEAYAKSLGLRRCIGLDMGGTSTDVCRIDGKLQLEYETIKAGTRMMVPTLAIHTVAAGGGSVCWYDGVQLRVGPNSAGASPGPACYGRGGPLTITDLNLLCNRIDASNFPFQLDRDASVKRLAEVLDSINATNDGRTQPMTAEDLMHGFRRIANEHMAEAVRSISIAQGADPRDHTLVGFGGAAGQHLCEIADILGMDHIIDPQAAGLLSALGMGMASVKRSLTKPLYTPLNQLPPEIIASVQRELAHRAAEAFQSEQISMSHVSSNFMLELRYVGTEGSVIVDLQDAEGKLPQELRQLCQQQFEDKHRAQFGYVRSGKELEVISMQAEFCALADNRLEVQRVKHENSRTIPSDAKAQGLIRESLTAGDVIEGPRTIISSGSTTFVETGWRATVLSDHTLSISRCQVLSGSVYSHKDELKHGLIDPVLREVLAHRIAAIAHQMGIVLEQTAMSVNVKDRRDFSCAVFAANGDLIANAPHVPVHLGAMSETIRCLIRKFPQMHPGDCFVTNDPYQGGSHLPDITVATPVFVSAGEPGSRPDFFVACRAHHAEIGGIAPGSMAPNSTRLGQEGVLIPPMKLVDQGVDCSRDVEQLLKSAAYPSRSTAENMADLAAQQAANQRGMQAMIELSEQYGLDTVVEYLEHIQSASEAKTRAWILSLGNHPRAFEDQMDDGTKIAVRISPTTDHQNRPLLDIDFSGTGPVSGGNLNANPAIVSAAIIYVIRCAVADSLPLNSGVMRCVSIKIPSGILNPQTSGAQDDWPAVAGGNVETSQRVVDCLLGALGLAAASQGTMNNFLFGNTGFGYYETIGGGTGATQDSDGEDAVHSHMTNTRLTDVEILEKRYPVRLVRFEIRQGSGGCGAHSGGHGIVRQIQALAPLQVSLVTSRRRVAPFGLEGGSHGKPGENWLIQNNGQRTPLPSSVQLSIEPGDSILIETPGGGGMRENTHRFD